MGLGWKGKVKLPLPLLLNNTTINNYTVIQKSAE
jgi:hypothetical protein